MGALRPVGLMCQAWETKPEQSRRYRWCPSASVAVPDWLYWMLRTYQLCAREITSERWMLPPIWSAAWAPGASAIPTISAAQTPAATATRFRSRFGCFSDVIALPFRYLDRQFAAPWGPP